MNSQYDVVIVGGGVGGLAVAWNLTTQAIQNGVAPPAIAIVEASSRWGGNADTMFVDFGTGPGFPTNPLVRWVDLGVNDFNTTAYTNIVNVMNTIGFTFGVDYKNLEDSTSYYTTDGSICFTDSASDVANSGTWWGTTIDPNLAASAASFMTVAGNDAKSNAQQFANYTIQQYIDEQGPKQTPPWSPDLGPKVIYPRINGMYFVSEMGPLQMPFLAVMHYYAIQEGAGGAPANRCYFTNGSGAWIAALVGYMQAKMPNITFALNYPAVINQVANSDPMYYCQNPNDPTQAFKATSVVLAAHADDCMTAMRTGLLGPVASIMASIKYNNGICVAHLDSRLLPVNSNAWSTYNIVIHEPGAAGLSPYEINYVVNRHQNDAMNPAYDTYGLPQYFVSINPHRPIPESMILKDQNGVPCVANLRHNNFDFAAMQAQSDIAKYQGVGNVYYAGGWTQGAGLHEECWIQGQDVAAMMLTHMAQGSPKGPSAGKDMGTFIGERLRRSAKTA
jgi:predicted NAD/FAD-binding protein